MNTPNPSPAKFPIRFLQRALAPALALFLAACTVGPDYLRPAMDIPDTYKETPPGWKESRPADLAPRGDWWTLYGDPLLNGLTERIDISNQNIQMALANYRQARAAAQEARAAFFPQISANASGNRSRSAGDSGSVRNATQITLDASWEADIWGGIRRSVEAGEAASQASAADLAAVRLSTQAELAQNYLQLRIVDMQRQLIADTVASYQRSLTLTQNRFAVGLVTRADVAQARSQLRSAEAQAIDLDLSRSQLEHAVAILIGEAPARFDLPVDALWSPQIPVTPPGIASHLLERRPDIASAERSAAAANARIGVARAAFFPSFTLSASGGYQGSSLADWFSAPARIWALGGSIAQFVFDGGRRQALSDQAVAAYDAAAASYKQTVLAGLLEVEDNLAALRYLADERIAQNEAVIAAREAEQLAINQYRAGTADFLNVVTAQTTLYNNERSALQLIGRQLSASVLLVKALGGGWDGDMAPPTAPRDPSS